MNNRSAPNKLLNARILNVTRKDDGSLHGYYRGFTPANLTVVAFTLVLTAMSLYFGAGLVRFIHRIGITPGSVVGIVACIVCSLVAGRSLFCAVLDIPTKIDLEVGEQKHGRLRMHSVYAKAELDVTLETIQPQGELLVLGLHTTVESDSRKVGHITATCRLLRGTAAPSH